MVYKTLIQTLYRLIEKISPFSVFITKDKMAKIPEIVKPYFILYTPKRKILIAKKIINKYED
mgnify:CR=1 FL=1